MTTEFLTVSGEATATTVICRSRFICYIKGIKDEQDAKDFISAVRKQNSLATHNCYAYVADEAGLVQKFSDDGEPQGTAGLPMLETLKGNSVKKVAAVVTRYFGGIKLGTGGLTRAYSGAISEALKSAKIVKNCLSKVFVFSLEYSDYQVFISVLDKQNCKIISTDFDNEVLIRVAVKSDFTERFTNRIADAFCGNLEFKRESEGFFAFE